MAQDPIVTIRNVRTLDDLISLEHNIQRGAAETSETRAAIEARYADFGRAMVAEKTGLELDDLSPAETRILNAIGRYVALQKRDRKGASRTFQIIANRGLIDAAEVTVGNSKVTQGFEVLDDADMRALSFEQIIVDYPEEFSARALWHANRTLGLPNDLAKPPADLGTVTQQRTEKLIDWLSMRAQRNGGLLNGYTNAELGQHLGFVDLTRHGRHLGNMQSRIDFGCYKADVPPLGLCAVEHFARGWATEGRRWAFPVETMRECAQSFIWTDETLDRVRVNTRILPGQAAIPWRKELAANEAGVRGWAESLKPYEATTAVESEVDSSEALALIQTEQNLLGRRPEVRERVSRSIERGSVGQKLKRASGFKCQLCEALGLNPIGFMKANDEPYVEAHHATPVSELEVGSLSASNIMILCANHHRQLHYGTVELERDEFEFIVKLDGDAVRIKRFAV
jgi:hypothetical protein